MCQYHLQIDFFDESIYQIGGPAFGVQLAGTNLTRNVAGV